MAQPQHLGKRLSTKGFTLIEILVVIVIISISVGLVVVNFSAGSEEDLAEEEITRLQQLLRFAHEQSVIRAQEYGVRFYKTGYRFMQFNEEDDRWENVLKDKLLRSRVLPQPLEINLYIDEVPVQILNSLDDDPELEDDTEQENKLASAASDIGDRINEVNETSAKEVKQIKPQVFLLSSSELTPQFELQIRIPGSDIEKLLYGLAQGEYTRELPDE